MLSTRGSGFVFAHKKMTGNEWGLGALATRSERGRVMYTFKSTLSAGGYYLTIILVISEELMSTGAATS